MKKFVLPTDVRSEPVLDARGLSVRYGARSALVDVDVRLGPGVTGLVGVNGAGKSTLIRVLCTRLRPDAGTLTVFGRDALDDPGAARRRTGYMPQALVVPGDVRVGNFLSYLAWMRGLARRDRAAAVASVLADVDLAGAARSKMRSLSGGMHRRVLLAQALLGEPDLLVLDEPTAGLDPEQRVRLRGLVSSASASRAVLVSSHLLEDLVPVADRILMLDEGRIVFDGSPDELAALGCSDGAALEGVSAHEVAFLRLRRGTVP